MKWLENTLENRRLFLKEDKNRQGYSKDVLVIWDWEKEITKTKKEKPRFAVNRLSTGDWLIEGISGKTKVTHFMVIKYPKKSEGL